MNQKWFCGYVFVVVNIMLASKFHVVALLLLRHQLLFHLRGLTKYSSHSYSCAAVYNVLFFLLFKTIIINLHP